MHKFCIFKVGNISGKTEQGKNICLTQLINNIMSKHLSTNYLIITLLIIVQNVTSQTNNSINLEFGSTLVDFKMKETTDYTTSSVGSSLSFYAMLNKETPVRSSLQCLA